MVGSVVVVGNLLCIALATIAAGAYGSVGIGEVYRLPKGDGAEFVPGDYAYYDLSESVFIETLAEEDYEDGDILNGAVVWKAAAAEDTTVEVMLLVRGGDITAAPPPEEP